MKKLLALVLALVMTLGLATVSSSAAFDDAESIKHTEAVDVLNTLGIVAGKGNNQFDPTGDVKRSEMAKMVAVAMLGSDVNDAAFAGVKTDLTDIKGHWAEGFINFCVSQGIVAGKGNGKFDPDANVTTTEAAKMLLVAIGYNSSVQGYTGDQWKINVTRDAQLSGFFKELTGLSADHALNRDEAAQMIYNTIQADMIDKTPQLNVNTGEISYSYNPNSSKHLMGETFGVYRIDGTVVGNEYLYLDRYTASSAAQKGKTEIVVTSDTLTAANDGIAVTRGNSYLFNVSTGADELGRNVSIFVKPSATSSQAGQAKVLGSAILNETDVCAVTAKSYSTAAKLNTFLKDNGLNTELGGARWWINGALQFTDGDGNGYQDAGEALTTFANTNAVKGYETKFTDVDDDGYVDYIIQTAYNFARVTAYSAANETITLNAALSQKYTDKDDVVGFENVAKNDWVNYAEIGGKLYIEKAEKVDGTVTGYNNDSISLDGTSYDRTGVTRTLTGQAAVVTVAGLSPSFTASTLYLDKQGNAAAINNAAVTDYCVVLGRATTSGTSIGTKVLVLLPDNTTKEYTYDSGNAKNGGAAGSAVNHTQMNTLVAAANAGNITTAFVATYQISGNEIIFPSAPVNGTIKANGTLVAVTSGNGLKYKSGDSLISNNNASIANTYITDSTVFLYVYASGNDATGAVTKAKAYVGGKNAPSVNLQDTDGRFYITRDASNNATSIAVLVPDGDDNNVNTSNAFLYVAKISATNDGYQTATIVIDGELKKDVQLKGTSNSTGMFEYSMDGERYKLGNELEGNAVAEYKTIGKITANTIVAGSTEYKLNAATQVAILDGNDTIMTDIAGLAEKDVVLVYDETSDGTAEAVYVVEQYDATNADLLFEAHGNYITAINTSAKTLTVKTGSPTNAQIVSELVVSSGAKIYYSTTSFADAGALAAAIGTTATEVTGDASTVNANGYLYILSDSQTEMTKYTLTKTA
jgi:hypothetical protein